MAEAEIALKYTTLPAVVLNRSLLVLLPLFCVFLIWSTIVLLLAAANGTIALGPTSAVILCQVLLFFTLATVAIVSADRNVFLSRDGISVPFFVSPGPAFRTELQWSDVQAVTFRPGGACGCLQLLFRGGRRFVLDLNRIPPETTEKLIVAMEVWSGNEQAFPALLEARMRVSAENSTDHSYTHLWEEELARRFGATNFVPLEPGHKLNHGALTVERQLAFGGLSAIYLVESSMPYGDNQESTKTAARKFHIVLKEAVIPPDADEQLRERSIAMLEREAVLLTKLSHPGLARVYDYFVENDRHYLLLEYVKGFDLRRLVREKGPVAEKEVVAWTKQLCDILQYIHHLDPPIVHRDLSPDNIILREDKTIALIDFGAANHFLGTATGTLIGKQAYIAPEQLRGKADARSDIYSLGASLHFLLTGEDPEPLSESRPRKIRTSVSSQLDDVVACCTRMEAVERFQSAFELMAALEEIRV